MKRFAFLLAFLLSCSAALAQQWSLELTKEAGAVLRYDGTRVMSFKYLAWGKDWDFAPFNTLIGPNQGDQWAITGDIKPLNIDVTGDIRHTGDVFTFTWDLKVRKPSQDNIGGGLEFNFRLNPQVFGPDAPKPKLLDDGWTWSPTPGQTVTARLSGAKAKSFFEKGRDNQIRLFFLPRDLQAGTITATLTLQLPPGSQRVNGVAIRYNKSDRRTWFSQSLDWTHAPIDLSYLNDKPAGGHGFVRAQGDKFVFADGTPARFWGCNVAAYALFDATDEAIAQQAKRLAALGFNLVRIHHHDSANWSPSVFVEGADNTRQLDDKALDRIDYWVKCLKDNGIYVWLDLHVGRPFRPGDQIEGFDELEKGKAGRQAKGFSYVNATVTEQMKAFANAYLTRSNTYTHTRYVDEPAVMGILVTNENDITNHFGNLFLSAKHHPVHQKWFEGLRDQIVRARGLNGDEAWRTWQPGESKVVLNEIEYQWGKDFVDYLHSIGVKVPIATTNTWGNNPLYSLPALTAGDMIDVHSYGTAETFSSNPKYDDMSTHWIAAAQVKDMPLAITEWNTPYPARDRFTQGLFIAANASFEGWDAPMLFTYQQAPLVPQSKLDDWTTSNDPAQMAMMPAAALLFRQQHVRPAEKTVVFAPGEKLLLGDIDPNDSVALRTNAERHRLVIGLPNTKLLPWLKGVDQGDLSDPNKIADGVDDTRITSDTGQLTRNFREGTYTIDSPKSQAALGWIGGQTIRLKDVTFNITTPKAAVAVTALDDQPIATSRRLLITAVAQAVYDRKAPKGRQILAEPVEGSITFKDAPTTVVTLSPAGKLGRQLNLENGRLDLSTTAGTHWYLVMRANAE